MDHRPNTETGNKKKSGRKKRRRRKYLLPWGKVSFLDRTQKSNYQKEKNDTYNLTGITTFCPSKGFI